MGKHPKGGNNRVSVKQRRIIAHQRNGPGLDALTALAANTSPVSTRWLQRRRQESPDRFAQFTPSVRFTLTDPREREFGAERRCLRGSIDGWIFVDGSGPVENLITYVIPTPGTENFYQLY